MLATTARAAYGVAQDMIVATVPALLTLGGTMVGGPVGGMVGALASVALYGGIVRYARKDDPDCDMFTARAAAGAAVSAACGAAGPVGLLFPAALSAGRRLFPLYLAELAESGKLKLSLPRYPWEGAQ
ncbi:MAG: hypothetical protein HY319_18135 [Armatimonadetes bacterium]|nr:hypothetical protein [Armatimonadota bacterium]